jgi:DNA-binding protein H-NS
LRTKISNARSGCIGFGYEKIFGDRAGIGTGSFQSAEIGLRLCRKNPDRFQANSHENAMRKPDLDEMELDELWQIHEELTRVLSDKIVAEKRELEKRLAQLNRVEIIRESGSANPLSMTDQAPRRKYPKVLPKYCNPLSPSETWSGRGKQPRWLVAALKSGHKLDELKIGNVEKEVDEPRAGRNRRT